MGTGSDEGVGAGGGVATGEVSGDVWRPLTAAIGSEVSVEFARPMCAASAAWNGSAYSDTSSVVWPVFTSSQPTLTPSTILT